MIKPAIDEAMSLLPEKMDTPSARILMVAFALQESNLEHRDQLEAGGKNTVLGPALGIHQMERGGGVLGVLRHKASRPYALKVCEARHVFPDSWSVWERLKTDDVLSFAFARLLIYTDYGALPSVSDVAQAWALYLRTWRPGAYERGSEQERKALSDKFKSNYQRARDLLEACDEPAIG